MSFYKLVHYLFGEYVFETDSNSFSRFANILSENSVNFWDSRYIDGKICFHASLFAAEDIINYGKKLHVPLKILSKKGLPFIFVNYRKRYGIFLGLAVGLFLIFFSQLFVWKINISGNVNMTSAQIENALAQCGVRVGTFIPALDAGASENRLLMDCRDLSSAAITLQGTHLSVAVLERTYLPDIIDTGGYYNVVASRDGVILDIDAADGTPEVTEGEAVCEGQLLINSFIEGNNGTFRPTHARGIVYAAVNEHFETIIPLERVSVYYTGATQTKNSYEILGWRVPSIFGDETDYEYFDAVSSEKIIKLFGFIELPVKQYRICYTEYIPQTQAISTETAQKLALAELEEYLDSLGLEVLECENSFIYNEKESTCKLIADAVLKQNIAKEVEFSLNQSTSDKFPNALE